MRAVIPRRTSDPASDSAIARRYPCSSSRSPMSRANVSSFESEIASAGSAATGRGSMPRARRRSSSPTRPGRSAARRPSSSSASRPIVVTPASASRALSLGADAGQRPHGQRRQERGLAARGHDRDPARLAGVRADLGHHLAGRDPERAREPQALAHGQLDQGGLLAGVALGQHQVALVDAHLLDHRGQARDQRPHPPRPVPVGAVVGRQEHHLGTAAAGLGAAHGRADAVLARLVAGRRHHPAPGRIAAHDHRPPAQLGVPVQLDRRKEGIEVEMRDHTAENSPRG